MNTKSLLIKGAVVAGSLSLLGGLGATLATSASASTGPQQFVTHAQMHPDTTSGSPSLTGIQNYDGSPVWAWDNVTLKFTPTHIDPLANNGDNWQVKVEVVGSFQGFADPIYGTPLQSTGDVHGVITYDVYSAGTPRALPAQQPQGVVDYSTVPATVTGSTSLSPGAPAGSMLEQLFGGPGSVTNINGGQDYSFSYQHGNYVQDNIAPYSHGDVTGH
jgi:hypothetical protein